MVMQTRLDVDSHEVSILQPSEATKRSRDGPCTREQANCALSCVLGRPPRGPKPLGKSDADHIHEHQEKEGQPGVITIYQQIQFTHEAHKDRHFRIRCNAQDTFHHKWISVSTNSWLSPWYPCTSCQHSDIGTYVWQSYFRSIRSGVSIQEFRADLAFSTNSPSHEVKAETWVGQLLSVFTCDLYCKDRQPQSCKLALVMWLEGAESRTDLNDFLSDVDKFEGTVPLRGCQTPHYDVIDVDRILGPEYIIPSFLRSEGEAQLQGRNYRDNPITDKEVWTTVALARKIGSAFPTTTDHD